MPGRGPAPQSEHTRDRNNEQITKLVSDGKTRGRALPRGILTDKNGEKILWHPMTVKWWNHWRKSPQAVRMMTEPDWDYLLDTARIHHEFWTSGRWELAAELRLRAAKFGATPEDRSRLRVEISTGLPSSPANSGQPAGRNNVSNLDAQRRQRVIGQTS